MYGLIPLSKVISDAKRDLEDHEINGLSSPLSTVVHPLLAASNLFKRDDFPARKGNSPHKANPFEKRKPTLDPSLMLSGSTLEYDKSDLGKERFG